MVIISLGVLLLLLMKPAKASLYPTKPVTNTTYIAGQAAHVTWVEDGTRPLLASLGRMKIDLFAGNNTLLATLAKDIDPLALSTTVYIPSSIPAHYYRFNLRFKGPLANSSSVPSRPLSRPRLHAPGIVVYTADFSITPNPLSVQSVFPLPTSTSGNATRTFNSSFSESTSTHPNVMPPLMPTPASRLAPSPTGKGRSGAVGRGSRGVIQRAGVGIGVKMLMGLHYLHGWNSEEMKFRLAFMVWPALIGLSIAA